MPHCKRRRTEHIGENLIHSIGALSQKRQKIDEVQGRVTALGHSSTHGGEDPPLEHKSRDPAAKATKSLFVQGLPRKTTSEELGVIFSQSFPIKHAFVVKDPSSTQSKGYGFVTFADAADAEQAKQTLSGSLIANQRILVEHADSRHRGLSGVEEQQQKKGSGTANHPQKQNGRSPEKVRQSTKLIVRNLPWTISTAGQLSSLFQSFGKIKRAIMPKVKHGLSPGFGFIMLRGRKNAEKAIQAMNGKEVDGRILAVDWSIPKSVWQESLAPNGEVPGQMSLPLVSPAKAAGDELSGSSPSREVFSNHNIKGDYNMSEFTETSDVPIIDGEDSSSRGRRSDGPSTLFVRNLSFTTTEEDLMSHFSTFGKVKYARIVYDSASGRPKGTAFVCFESPADADQCLRNAPIAYPLVGGQKVSSTTTDSYAEKESILQNTTCDVSGLYTLGDRVLHVSAAITPSEALRIATARHSSREQQDVDRRRLYLLSEGTISATDPTHEKLSPSEIQLREDSLKQRQALLKSNPGLHLSLTRLSVRNIPRNISSKSLKALARQAVVGFAEDVKAGRRDSLSKEEMRRGGNEDRQAEKARRAKGKGLVKQAKVVFESKEGSKVDEKSQAGRSRGYGFIEYHSHRAALMGLRWLNGHAIEQSEGTSGVLGSKTAIREQRKRLVVEFAIENMQVVNRRHGREERAQQSTQSKSVHAAEHLMKSNKTPKVQQQAQKSPQRTSRNGSEERANRQRIIGRKRMLRKSRKGRL